MIFLINLIFYCFIINYEIVCLFKNIFIKFLETKFYYNKLIFQLEYG